MQLHIVSSLDYLSCIAIEVAQIEFCRVIYMLKKTTHLLAIQSLIIA